MTPEDLQRLIAAWTADTTDPVRYGVLDEHIDYLARAQYRFYEPTRRPSPPFRARLSTWLGQALDDSVRRTLFRLVPELFFVGRGEFESLYRLALTQHIALWYRSLAPASRSPSQLRAILSHAASHTWFCPITDSMQIASFCHVNGLTGPNYRPDWRSLAVFGDPHHLRQYMTDHGLTKLVLLEDFVGSGSQMRPAVRFAARTLPNVDVLVIALVACPPGVEEGDRLADEFPRVTFRPVLPLPPEAFLRDRPAADEPELFAALRRAVHQLRLLVSRDNPHFYSVLGFGNTGGLIVMHTNCPDNSLPIIHVQTDHWTALFPRASRL